MKWLLRIVFLLVAVVGLVIGALLMMPGDKLAAILTEQVRGQTGRDLKLSGDVNLSFWPVLGMETGPVTFSNASWAGPEPMLSADSMAVGVDAAALISGDLRIRRIIAENPTLRLELSEGRGNWQFDRSTPVSSGNAVSAQSKNATGTVTLDFLELTNARLVYVENDAVKFDFANVDLSANWPDVTAPLFVEAKMDVPGGKVEVDLKIPDLPAYATGVAAPLELLLRAPGGEVDFDGLVNLAGEMDGKLHIKAQDTEKMLAAFGQAGVGVPLGLGRKAEVAGHMTYTSEGRISLREMVAQLDDNRLTGEADIVISDPPQITARLNGGDLDLSRFNAPSGEGGVGGGSAAVTAAEGWSTTPIDASALALANGKIRLTANSIAVPELTLGPSDLTLNLDRSRAVLQMNPATLFSGKLTGQVVANNRNGLSVGGNLQAEGIDLQSALSTLADVTRLSGTGSGSFEFLGVGQSEDQIMRSLSGKGRLDVGRGVISGIDLDRIMGRGDGNGGATVFNSLTASFTIDQGVLRNEDLLMSLDNFRADGKGTVGIGARNIDYLFTPTALRANSGQGLSVPVRIVGPWSNPSIQPDLSKVIEAAAEGKIKELEGDAKQQVLDKVGDELGTAVTDSESLEKAVKKKLEEEAKKGLLKLLGAD
ncbi:putative assembly protein [Ruegeria sp. THAF57]|uniref:AsmA family protein n=1 Tax=Ruegeria sp. THAF57 TaxID=2744555 RepID=UPI0015DD7AD1|nr:AsmA family protein [Ruegeria sp. THAF57]CAD0183748.1 putative assembly protein [Ruegeria sp. THAF57]